MTTSLTLRRWFQRPTKNPVPRDFFGLLLLAHLILSRNVIMSFNDIAYFLGLLKSFAPHSRVIVILIFEKQSSCQMNSFNKLYELRSIIPMTLKRSIEKGRANGRLSRLGPIFLFTRPSLMWEIILPTKFNQYLKGIKNISNIESLRENRSR